MIALPTEAVELYGLDPGAFVAARNALVKGLKRDKRGADAAVVAALRRPSPADHAINAAVRAQPDVATVWVDAVTVLDDEQRAAIGGAPNHLREAGAALREATARLVDAAVAAVGDERRRSAVIDALRAAATRPGAGMVAAGILGAGDPTDELFAGAPDPAPRPARTTAKDDAPPSSSDVAARHEDAAPPTTSRAATGRGTAGPPRPDRSEREDRAAAKAAALAERLAAAEAAAQEADDAVEAARQAEAAARTQLTAASAELRQARTAATRAAAALAAARRAAT